MRCEVSVAGEVCGAPAMAKADRRWVCGLHNPRTGRRSWIKLPSLSERKIADPDD